MAARKEPDFIRSMEHEGEEEEWFVGGEEEEWEFTKEDEEALQFKFALLNPFRGI